MRAITQLTVTIILGALTTVMSWPSGAPGKYCFPQTISASNIFCELLNRFKIN